MSTSNNSHEGGSTQNANSLEEPLATLPPIYVPEGEKRTPLATSWAFWCQKKKKTTKGSSNTNWSEGTQCVGRFSTVEGFWQLYSHIIRADKITGSVDIMLFRDGIRPVWEDEANKNGGKLSIKTKKGISTILWEELILGMIGEHLSELDICGAVLSVRFHDDNIALWLRNADSDATVSAAKASFRSILRLPSWCNTEFSKFSRRGGAGDAAEGEEPTAAQGTHQRHSSTWKQNTNSSSSSSSLPSDRSAHSSAQGQHHPSSHFQQHQRGSGAPEKMIIYNGPGVPTLTIGGMSTASAAGLSLASARAGNISRSTDGYAPQQQQSPPSLSVDVGGLSSLPLTNMSSLPLRPKTLGLAQGGGGGGLPQSSTSGGGSSPLNGTVGDDRSLSAANTAAATNSVSTTSPPATPQPVWGASKSAAGNSTSVTSVVSSPKQSAERVPLPVVQAQQQQQQVQISHISQVPQQMQQPYGQQQYHQQHAQPQQNGPRDQQLHQQYQRSGQFQRQPHYSQNQQQQQQFNNYHQGQQHYQHQQQQQQQQQQQPSAAQKHSSDEDVDGWETVPATKKR
jgi:translation initiation factor 4E